MVTGMPVPSCKEIVPLGLTPCLLDRNRLRLTNIHHTDPSACTKVVKILTFYSAISSWLSGGNDVSYCDGPIFRM